MKKHAIFAVMLAAAVTAGFGGCTKEEVSEEKSTSFDASQIVLSFSAMSDVHQQRNHPEYSEKLVNALNVSAELNGGALDLALLAGDLTEDTWKKTGRDDGFTTTYNVEAELLKNALDEALDLERTAVFYALGNHDSDPTGIGGEEGKELMAQMPKLFHDTLGEQFFRADAEDSAPEEGMRHAVVNGYHFFSVMPETYWNLKGFSAGMLSWLDEKLAAVTAAEPEKYVFVTAHPPIYETVWGSYASDWSDSSLRTVLDKYPQVFYLSGHIHNVLNDEMQISQNGFFTSVDCGGVRATGMMNQINNVNGPSFDNALSGMHADDFSQGLLLQVDANGNIRVNRCNYLKGEFIKQPWEVPHPMRDNSHLLAYDNETRRLENAEPEFSPDAKFTVTYEKGSLSFAWDAAKDDDEVRYYKVRYYKYVNDKPVRQAKAYNLATFTYLYDRAEDMPKSLAFNAGVVELPAGKYLFEIAPIDAWDATGAVITAELTVE